MKLLNYKGFSFFIAIILLIIVSSGNTSHVTGSDAFIYKIQNLKQSNLASVSLESYSMNDRDEPLESIQTSSFEPNWVDKAPSTSPEARKHSAMVYDSFNDKTILFGGNNGSASDILADTWAYNYPSNTWENMNPATSPSPIDGHAMVYDSSTHKVVFFGAGETWTYDYSKNIWQQQSPQISPSNRKYHSMVYDTIRQKILMIGGTSATFETWEMDSLTYNWTNLSPLTPIPRLFAIGAAFDQANDKIIVFGGQDTSPLINAGETYAFDYSSNEWTLLNPIVDPTDRRFYGKPMGYTPIAQKSVFFGGYNDSGSTNETWAFDYSTTTWELIDTTGTPSPRWIHTMIFNTQANKFIMFGGIDAGLLGHTYELTSFDSQPPQIISPGNKMFELGGVTSSISWQLLDPSDGSYEIRLDNLVIDTGNFVDGQTISLVPFGLSIGDYVLKMMATDLNGNSASDTITLYIIEVDPPIIFGPEDMEIEVLDSNKNITWILEDLTPASYNVKQNGTIIAEGAWQNGDRVIVDLNSLAKGHYVFTIMATDTFDNVASDTVLVNILDTGIPSISSPTDMDLIQGDPNKEIIWYISDNNPTFYILEVNQQGMANNSWVALPFVSERLVNYIAGNYNFTLILHDGNGNIVSDTVVVRIHPKSVNTQTQKPPSGSGGGSFGSFPPIPPEVVIGAGVLGGGALFFAVIRRIRGGGRGF